MVTKFLKIKVKEIMQKRNVPVLERTAPIDRILPFLTTKTHVWVTARKKSKKVVGVITEHDVLNILSPRRGPYTFGFPDMRCLRGGTAEDIMTKRVIGCSPEETIEDVLNKMMRHGMRRLPVTKRGDIMVGEIRLYHIIKKFSEMAEGKR